MVAREQNANTHTHTHHLVPDKLVIFETSVLSEVTPTRQHLEGLESREADGLKFKSEYLPVYS